MKGNVTTYSLQEIFALPFKILSCALPERGLQSRCFYFSNGKSAREFRNNPENGY